MPFFSVMVDGSCVRGSESLSRAFSEVLFVRLFFDPPKGQNPMLLNQGSTVRSPSRVLPGQSEQIRSGTGICWRARIGADEGAKGKSVDNEWRKGSRTRNASLSRGECVRRRVLSKPATGYVRADLRG